MVRIPSTAAALAATLAAWPPAAAVQADTAPSVETAVFDAQAGPALRRFASIAEFEAYLASLRTALRRAPAEGIPQAVIQDEEFTLSGATNVEAVLNELPQVTPSNPAITNNQTVGVDEGGIVKQIGRFLIVLQDGRLFSADLGSAEGAQLRLADRIDVYRSRTTAASWYDEMLVSGNRILVTAYNYRERASEISVFTLDPDGRLSREGRFLINSNDYYSTDNYATRLVGDSLVIYTPLALASGPATSFAWPRLRRADGDGAADSGTPLIGPTEVYAPVGEVGYGVIHTISVCPLRSGMQCRTTAFIGPWMREFYLSPTDAFLWIGAPDGLPWSIDYANERRRACPPGEFLDSRADQQAMLYRVPLDGGPVGAVAVEGTPEDQFAFDSRDGRFRALLERADGRCSKDGAPARLALLDIPLAAFGTAVRHVADRAYTPVPSIAGDTMLENRFIGDWLVYGGRSNRSGLDREDRIARRPSGSILWAVPLTRPDEPLRVALPHNAIRIERAANDAVVTGYGSGEGLSLSYVTLVPRPRLAATTFLDGRYESEGRSHAFGAWIREDRSGLIGIPTARRSRAGRSWSNSESSELSYVAVAPDRSLAPAGQLSPALRRPGTGYRCVVSCVDWYGNSRPIFTGGRVFALMGTDLVEGRLANGRMTEIGRVDLTARPALARR